MILLDTHIWIWLVTKNAQLTKPTKEVIEKQLKNGLGLSVISCWEVSKLVERGRLSFSISMSEWMEQALAYPGIQLLDLTPRIAIESTELPEAFHRDPADQIIVATARVHDLPLLTMDTRILKYPHVKTFPV